jgi:hypothetical protein
MGGQKKSRLKKRQQDPSFQVVDRLLFESPEFLRLERWIEQVAIR